MLPPVVGLVKFTAVVGEPLHTTWLVTGVTVAVGFTVIVKLLGVPVQVTPLLVYDGVIVIVATAGDVPALTALKAGIFPVPLAARPMDVLLLVQL